MAQTAHGPNGAAGTARPLAGARAWLITDGKTGMDVQVAGVAEELGVLAEVKRVDPKGLWRFAAPWGPAQPSDRLGKPGSAFMPPWPDIAIATGRLSIPYIRAIRKAVSDAGATCVFAEPQFEPKLISVVTEGTNARSGTLDPLGAAVEPGPDLYFTLIRDMAGAMRDCLSAEG